MSILQLKIFKNSKFQKGKLWGPPQVYILFLFYGFPKESFQKKSGGLNMSFFSKGGKGGLDQTKSFEALFFCLKTAKRGGDQSKYKSFEAVLR